MKPDILILSPNAPSLLSPVQIDGLKHASRSCTIVDKPIPLEKVVATYNPQPHPLVLGLDPDFVAWNAPKTLYSAFGGLYSVCLQSTSFSWLDVGLASKHGIVVTNLRNWSTNSVAEWAILMMLNVSRRIPEVIRNNWREDFPNQRGMELSGRTAGIIGLGHIGKRIAELCCGLGMNVHYWSKTSRDPRFRSVSLDNLMKSSDVIFPAVAQNMETQGLITDAMLRSMKPTALFVSIVHRIYNHDLLIKMAESGKMWGYAFESEETVFNTYKSNIWAGPSLGWNTTEARARNAEQWVQTILNAASHHFPTRVN